MNNELERILSEAADDATRRSGNLPVDELRGRGVRRRRTRQAGYSVVGVAAAFGLAFGAAQIVPDDGEVGPAVTPTADLPTVDSSLPLGACGSDVTNLPLTDGLVWLELSNEEVVVPVGADSPVAVTVQNFDAEPLDLSRGEGPYLFAARDGVVVGFSWPTATGNAAVPAEGEQVHDDFGPFVICEQGELRPSGDASGRAPLPVGTYTVHSAITLRPDSERVDPQFPWTFDLLGRNGSLTVLENGTRGTSAPDPSDEPSANPDNEELAAVDVALPVCGEPIAGFEFPEGVHVDPAVPLEVTVGHTGIDDAGDETFYTDGYGDQLQVTLDFVNRIADWASARELDAGIVVARDGVVVAELDLPSWQDLEWTLWPLSESRSFSPTEDWVDCASGEHGQVPKGDYEILGWRTFEFTDADGASGSLTVGYEPVPFTAYDFEDPDNPGPGTD